MKISIITATHHRPEKLSEIALPSLLAQTNTDFEWILINDGSCTATKDIIKNTNFPFEVTYQEMPHPTSGFGLCHARNLGLELASGQAIAYLDDDNWLYPSFVAKMSNLLENNPQIKCCLPSQNRSRMIINNKSVQAGK